MEQISQSSQKFIRLIMDQLSTVVISAWSGDGDTVPEYQEVMNNLNIGELSEPFRSQFGWHLVEVTEHRTVDETEESKREKIRQQLLRQKQQEAFDIWQRQLRAETFIDFPEA